MLLEDHRGRIGSLGVRDGAVEVLALYLALVLRVLLRLLGEEDLFTTLAAAGLAALTLLIALLNVVAWSPLEYWARRFRYEFSAGAGDQGAALPVIGIAMNTMAGWQQILRQQHAEASRILFVLPE